MKPKEQLKALRELVTEDERLEDSGIEEEGRKNYPLEAASAMKDMLRKFENGFYEDGLSPKQIAFVKSLYARVFEADAAPPTLMASGEIPRGREVPLPEVLRNLPMRPPGRRA